MQNARILNSFILFFLSIIFLLFSTALMASAGEAEHSASLSDWLSKILNFSILVVLLYILISKFRVGDLLKKRSEAIAKAISDAEEAKETARKGFEAIQNRLNEKDREMDEIINAAKAEGEKEKTFLIQEGERIGEGIVRQAKENIDREVRKARESLREEAVNLALGLAEGRIKENLKKEDEEIMINGYIKKIGDVN